MSGTVLGATTAAPASAAGEDVIAWVEVEDGVISGGPALNSGDHGNFSGTGSYTFRETGMTSTMTVNAPEAGVYPVYVRYAAGPLGAGENVTRSMGLVVNGDRQQMSLPMTSFEDWETWRFTEEYVSLDQGANTIAISCDRSIDFCRLNFDAIQVGGSLADDTCLAAAILPPAGWTSLFDGTFATFDGWRKAGSGGFGRRVDCSIRGFRGQGATWFTTQQTAPYTLEVDWRRAGNNDHSGVYVGSSSRSGTPGDGYRIPIGADTGAIVTMGGATKSADAAKVAAVVKPLGQWNTYTIQVTATQVWVRLNGVLVNSLDRAGAAPANGFVGLENRSGAPAVDFRSVRLRPGVDLGRLAAPFTRATLAGGATVNPGGESTLGNLVAEAQRRATATPAQISFVHPGALGADLRGTPGGYPATLTHAQAAPVLPSADTLVTMKLTGAQVRTVLEQQWQRTAGGTVPAVAFQRLGTSAGFTYTYDPTGPEGSRVQQIWLDGTPLVPTASYSVTVPKTLADGGVNFRIFSQGTDRQDTGRTGLAALADLVQTATDGGEPLAVDPRQHSVGVAFPGGAPASYAAGDELALDLSSLAFSGESDPRDTSVAVTLDGEPLGEFDVDNTVDAQATDETGRAQVRTTVPAGTPPGAATVRIVGDVTGTTVEVPIVVAGDSTTSLTVAPGTVTVRRDKATVSVSVAAAGGPPTGQVELLVGADKVATLTLVDGRATGTVGPFPTVGNRTVTARYLGSATALPSQSGPATVVVRKVAPTVTAKVQPRKVVAKKTAAKVVVSVRATGVTPSGRVTVRIGAKTYAGTLRSGAVTIRLAKFKKPGTVRATISYLGDALSERASTTARIKVAKAKKKR
ncbi:5'-nucleotidase C-terminal domain-containing protein [Nocardioides sp. SYSU D00038]|uniref:5'-nucleotidase C-terminal domain-containing protein n=1 Tax=Nocardioides sp. SYSU D00038 TaxID=2812554 RepID=UPI0019680F95|nr:5'-nucleotidase C-terminal domain-containing protein [Nocardioides sp. SYSU D00038]